MGEADYAELVEYVADRMAAGAHKHALHRDLVEAFGPVNPPVYEKLRRLAEELNRERCHSKSTELGDAIAWYKSVIDGDVDIKHKLRAREQLSKILGIEYIQGSAQEQSDIVRGLLEKMRDP